MEIDKIEWFKKDFIKEYVSLLKSGRNDFKKYLLSNHNIKYLGSQVPKLNFVGQIEDESKKQVLIALKQEKEVLGISSKLMATKGDSNSIKKIMNKLSLKGVK